MLPTPPQTESKHGMFSRKKQQMPFYEDLYGKRNPDEGVEGIAERCESESDTDEEVEEYLRTEQYQRMFAKGTSTKTRTSEVHKSGQQYRIAPRFNSKRSLATSDYDKVKSNRFGMFNRTAADERILEKDVAPTIELSDDEVAKNTQDVQEKSQKLLVTDQDAKDEPPIRRGRIPRPTSRRLINQQLKEKAAADKMAAQKAIQTAAHLAKKGQSQELGGKKAKGKGVMGGKVKKSSKKLPASNSDGVGFETCTKKDAQKLKTGYVVIDNSGVDFEEYQRM